MANNILNISCGFFKTQFENMIDTYEPINYCSRAGLAVNANKTNIISIEERTIDITINKWRKNKPRSIFRAGS